MKIFSKIGTIFNGTGEEYIEYNIRGEKKKFIDDYKGAIEEFSKAIKLKPNYEEAYYNRGMSKAKLKNYNSAIEDFTKSIELKPGYAVTHYRRGLAKYCLNDFSGALDDFNIAINLNPLYTEIYYNRGCAKLKLSKLIELRHLWQSRSETVYTLMKELRRQETAPGNHWR